MFLADPEKSAPDFKVWTTWLPWSCLNFLSNCESSKFNLSSSIWASRSLTWALRLAIAWLDLPQAPCCWICAAPNAPPTAACHSSKLS